MRHMAVIKFNGQKFNADIQDDVDQSVANEIFKFREYRMAEECIARAKDPIIDVGAHVGFFSLYCRALNPRVTIFAIEPEPGNVKRLEKNLAQNNIENVFVEQSALAGKTGKRILMLSPDSHNHRLFEGNAVGQTGLQVSAYSLADFCQKHEIKKISVLKMDIEGGEYEVLEEMMDHDFFLVENIILEYHDLDHRNFNEGGFPEKNHKFLEKILRENGFSVQIMPSQFDKTMGFIFARNKRS